MAEQLHWLPLSLCASNSKFSFSCSNLNWVLLQNIFVTKFSAPSLPCQSVLSDPLTGLTFLFPVLGPQWLNPDPLRAYVPLYGIDFRLLYALKSSLVASLPLSLTLKPSFFLGVLRTGSASERLML